METIGCLQVLMYRNNRLFTSSKLALHVYLLACLELHLFFLLLITCPIPLLTYLPTSFFQLTALFQLSNTSALLKRALLKTFLSVTCLRSREWCLEPVDQSCTSLNFFFLFLTSGKRNEGLKPWSACASLLQHLEKLLLIFSYCFFCCFCFQ